MSLIAEISSPAACNERIAASRPAPGPLTHTSTRFIPRFKASRALASAATCAANGVLLRDPLKPALPALAQVTTLPSVSVIVTMVLLNVACTCATPFVPTRRSRFLVFFGSATRYLHPGLDGPCVLLLRCRFGGHRFLHHTGGLLGALARACVGLGALAAHR